MVESNKWATTSKRSTLFWSFAVVLIIVLCTLAFYALRITATYIPWTSRPIREPATGCSPHVTVRDKIRYRNENAANRGVMKILSSEIRECPTTSAFTVEFYGGW